MVRTIRFFHLFVIALVLACSSCARAQAGSVNSTGVIFRVADGNRNTVVDSSLLEEGALSGNGSGPLPWGLNLISIPWTWGQDPITYHAGTHDFRIVSGNAQEHSIVLINGGGIVFPGGNGASIIYSDGTTQSTAWNGVLFGGDYAESVDVSGDRDAYQPGDVLVIDPSNEGRFLKSSVPYSTAVTGIYSSKPGVVGRRQHSARTHMNEEVPMAMNGIVPTKVSTENGPIKAGDLLVSSSRSGYAMKGTDRSQMLGAVIGKAIGHLDSGVGVIEAVVTLQ